MGNNCSDYCEKINECTIIKLKDNVNKQLLNRVLEREAVIYNIAQFFGIKENGNLIVVGNYLLNMIKEIYGNDGDKVKLKKRIKELENQVNVLTDLLKKGGKNE